MLRPRPGLDAFVTSELGTVHGYLVDSDFDHCVCVGGVTGQTPDPHELEQC